MLENMEAAVKIVPVVITLHNLVAENFIENFSILLGYWVVWLVINFSTKDSIKGKIIVSFVVILVLSLKTAKVFLILVMRYLELISELLITTIWDISINIGIKQNFTKDPVEIPIL